MCRSIILFDLDGTLFENFFEEDREIITRIFNGNKLVLLVDYIARSINDLDFFKNTTWLLNFRLWVYSILGFKSYKEVKKQYKSNYLKAVNNALIEKRKIISIFKDYGYQVIVVSNNMYSRELDTEFSIITTKNKMNMFEFLNSMYSHKIEYIVGDNYLDDIIPAYELGIRSIYIKRNDNQRILQKKYKAKFIAESFDSACEIILNML